MKVTTLNPNLEKTQAVADPFRRLTLIMDILLSPEGCPWDREQTHESLLPYLIEEAYEVKEDTLLGNWSGVKQELGDVALQVVFHAALGRRENRFDIDGVLESVCAKLIRRHPHVFGEPQTLSTGEVLHNWEAIKRQEKVDAGQVAAIADASVLGGVPQSLPALQRAQRVQEKAARVNFDWPHIDQVWAKVEEEFAELKAAHAAGDARHFEEELGDLLFALVNLARFEKIWAEIALGKTIAKFHQRFSRIEAHARDRGIDLTSMTLAEMDAIWNAAKEHEASA